MYLAGFSLTELAAANQTSELLVNRALLAKQRMMR